MTYETLMEAAGLSPLAVVGCIAVIVVGVAVIMYVLFHAPKDAAAIGDRPEIGLGDDGDAPAEDDGAPDEIGDGADPAPAEEKMPAQDPAPTDDAPAEDGQAEEV